jgi:hypothetical protein
VAAIQEQQKELEAVVHPIMARLYQEAGGGGEAEQQDGGTYAEKE